MTSGDERKARPSDAWFATTHWSAVLTAAGSDTTRAQAALEKLCQIYWYPLYAYARRRGYSAADAEDLTQGFFARLLKLESLADVCREKGKFRSFLLAGMNHYLADERDALHSAAEAAGARLRRRFGGIPTLVPAEESAGHLTAETCGAGRI